MLQRTFTQLAAYFNSARVGNNPPKDLAKHYDLSEGRRCSKVGCINYQPVHKTARLTHAEHFSATLKYVDDPKIKWDKPIKKSSDILK